MRRLFFALAVVVGVIALGCKSSGKKDAASSSSTAPTTANDPPTLDAATTDAATATRVPGPLGRSDAELLPLRESIPKLAPLHVRATPPKPGEWLAEHREAGESFEQYLNAGPITPTAERASLVVQPLGDLGKENDRVVSTVAKAMEAFFGLPTRVVSALSVSQRIVPQSARRPSRGYGEQLLTTHILQELKTRLPSDAMAFVAFTSNDLWPGDDWNYVFGQASLENRVGVWSLARNGNPSTSEATYRLALVRAIKIATHETGHMFGMHHCTAYRCNMAGVNSLDESDAHPMWLCPECLAKLAWVTGSSAESHLRRMQSFSHDAGLKAEQTHYTKSLTALGK